MTLFKKVFQNQSRPATEEGAIDEAALRSVFAQSSEPTHPLVLDPFQHGVQPEPDQDVSEAEVWVDAHDGQGDDTEVACASDEPDTGQNPAWDADVVEADVIEEVDPEGHEARPSDALSDADIVARLDRALAVAQPVSHQVGDEQDSAAEAGVADDVSDGITPEQTGEPGAGVCESGDAGTSKDGLDIAAFAQRQMAALDATKEQPRHKAQDENVAPEPLDLSGSALAPPANGRNGRRAGRVKTRLLGFSHTPENDPLEQAQEATATAQREKYPVGWLVIVEGPGLGHAFSIFAGASMIGRGEDQVIRLDFGDNAISRHNHAAVAYDEEQNKFYIGHGGKSNIIRRNARPVLSTEELHHADLVRIGETTLRFVALCGSDFQWHGTGVH